MGGKFVTALFFVFVGYTSVFFFIGALVIRFFTQWFDPGLRVLHLYTSMWSTFYFKFMKCWNYSVSGRENINNRETYVVISNHQSLLDILIVFTCFFHFKWVSKVEIFKIPLIGWNMMLNKYIQLKRGDKKSIEEMMAHSEKTLKKGSSVYIFPEGTRSATGVLRPFKSGAFILAKKLNLPILPIVINGTINALPKNNLNYHGVHSMTIDILKPVYPEVFESMNVEETGEYFRSMISGKVEAHQAGGYENLHLLPN